MKRFLFYIIATSTLLVGCKQEKKQLENGTLWLDDNNVHINAHGLGVLKEGETYYLYGEHKVEGDAGNYAQVGIACYSSKNLVDWKNEGIVLKVVEDSVSDIAKGSIIERPKVIFNRKTDKYVMWFHSEILGMGYKAARSGVAVSKNPTGPFTLLKTFRPNAGCYPINVLPFHRQKDNFPIGRTFGGGQIKDTPDQGNLNFVGRDLYSGQMARDMNLFVDEDETAYLIYSSEENSTLHISRLTDDYLDTDSLYIRIFPCRFHEAPAMFKRDGKYYMITSGCTSWNPNAARSMVADSILGEWTELGNPCRGENAELTFGGQGTYVLQVGDRYIFMADIWRPTNAIDGRYFWLDIKFEEEKPIIEWQKYFEGL